MSGDHNMYASGNQPAFPTDCNKNIIYGMTLRDYFAAKALQELVGVLAPSDCARRAYQYADEMLKAREA